MKQYLKPVAAILVSLGVGVVIGRSSPKPTPLVDVDSIRFRTASDGYRCYTPYLMKSGGVTTRMRPERTGDEMVQFHGTINQVPFILYAQTEE